MLSVLVLVVMLLTVLMSSGVSGQRYMKASRLRLLTLVMRTTHHRRARHTRYLKGYQK